ncbi:MAG TPA: ABC transporter permease [Candidatus Acidoferrum sp.]|nr:ABC transporter permease [Candidatus Acidoferrum sp.]
MSLQSSLRSVVSNLFHRSRMEKDTEEELRSHVQNRADDLERRGLTRPEAERRARIEFGTHEKFKEECREARGGNIIQVLLQDSRYAVRILGRTPLITAVALLSLGLGIGANTAIFSLIDTVMLRLLPVRQPEELVQILRSDPSRPGSATSSFTNPLWEQVRDHQDPFAGTFAWSDSQFNLAQGGAVRYVNGVYTSGGFFNTLGIRAAAGRLFSDSDDQRGCPATAVLSYGFWQEHFGGEQSAIGSTLPLNNHTFQIIGVSASGFYGVDGGSKFDVAVPVCASSFFDGKESRLDHRSWWWLNIMGRIKPGLSTEQAKARLAVLAPQVFAAAVPQDWDINGQQRFRKRTLVAVPAATGTSYMRRQFSQPLYILMSVVGLVLLIACANIASLMVARSAARQKELAVRKALGASRWRLIRQLLTECLLLSSAGALLGVLFARWGTALLVRYISTANNKIFLDLSLNWRILSFTAAVAVLTGLLFGTLPALRSTRVSLTSAMKGGSQSEGSERRGRLRPGKWIVASQVALSLVLLVTSGLFLHSFFKLVTLDLGFDRRDVLLVNANLKSAEIPPAQQNTVFDEIEISLGSIPGVVAVGRSVRTPVSNFEWNQHVQADSPDAPKGEDALVFFNFISSGYFPVLRTPLLEGRNFNGGDTGGSARVVIVNQTLARRFFPRSSALGQYIRIDDSPNKRGPAIQIVGVVRNSTYESLREESYSQAFFPASQIPEATDAENFELRAERSPSALISSVQDVVLQMNKGISLDFHSLAAQVDDSLVQDRLLATLSTFFGGLALLLAMIGLYGALSYLVTMRRSEFGVRMALGAKPASILSLVMKDVAVVLGGGLTAGAFASLFIVQFLQKMLFGLTGHDPITMVAAIGLLSVAAFLAAYLPARRAMRVDPMVALRYE